MRSRKLLVGLVLCALGCTAAAQSPAAETDSRESSAAPEPNGDKPEYSRRSLPADTFKPSEEISEDFPVPFPVDI